MGTNITLWKLHVLGFALRFQGAISNLEKICFCLQAVDSRVNSCLIYRMLDLAESCPENGEAVVLAQEERDFTSI